MDNLKIEVGFMTFVGDILAWYKLGHVFDCLLIPNHRVSASMWQFIEFNMNDTGSHSSFNKYRNTECNMLD